VKTEVTGGKMKNEPTQVLLFVSRESAIFQSAMEEFQKLIKVLEGAQPFTSRIIDVFEETEMADEYHIDATPTLVIGDKRFIGIPDAEKIAGYLGEQLGG
jgi:hypothetical protein